MRAAGRQIAGAVLAGFVPGWLEAAEAVRDADARLKSFGLADGQATPGFGRVAIVFLIVAGLAWGVAWALRRFGPRLGLGQRLGVLGSAGANTVIRTLARSSLSGGGTCHLLEVQGNRVLITVTRHGVSSVVLDEARPSELPAP